MGRLAAIGASVEVETRVAYDQATQLKTKHCLLLTLEGSPFVNALILKEYIDEVNSHHPA